MNLFYEKYPDFITVNKEQIPIVTDFREIVRLFDLLKDSNVNSKEKYYFLSQYFKKTPSNFAEAVDKLATFITLEELNGDVSVDKKTSEDKQTKKTLFSFELDYPYIFSAFLRDYRINIRTIPYMHWWEFKMLFDGLSEDTEIKQRIMYRGINLSEIKDENERKRIAKIQRLIQLPEEIMTDYDIGDALW